MALRLLRPAMGPLRLTRAGPYRNLSTVGLTQASQARVLLARAPRSITLPPTTRPRHRPNSTLTTPQPPPPKSNPLPPPPPPEPQPTSAYARFKQLTKTYGSYAILMYLALSAVDFGLSFALVHSVGADRIQPYMTKLVRLYRELRHGHDGADALERADVAQKAADEAEAAAELAINGPPSVRWWSSKALWAELVLAYSIHKIALLPLRAGLTVAWTPKVVNWLSRRGWIGKGGWRRGAQHGVDKARAAGQRAVEQAKEKVRR